METRSVRRMGETGGCELSTWSAMAATAHNKVVLKLNMGACSSVSDLLAYYAQVGTYARFHPRSLSLVVSEC